MKIKYIAFLQLGILAFSLFALTFAGGAASQPQAASDFAARAAETKLSKEEMNGVYNFDLAHSNIGFRIKHMGLAEVPGSFTDYSGTINYNADDVTKSSVNFTAKVASVNTGIGKRDEHLRTADFFEVEKFPEMSFKSTKIEKKSENQFVATGDFTLKGVTKQIALPFTINGFLKDQRGVKIGASAVSTINRQDYGITWGKVLDSGALALSNDVQINLQIEAAKPQPKPEAAK